MGVERSFDDLACNLFGTCPALCDVELWLVDYAVRVIPSESPRVQLITIVLGFLPWVSVALTSAT